MIFEGRTNERPSTDVIAFRDRLEEATYTAGANRGTDAAIGAPPAPRPQTPPPAQAQQPTTVPPANEASTVPMQPSVTPPAKQGFQPVSEGEIRTESLDGKR